MTALPRPRLEPGPWNVEEFHAFLASRSQGERWQLIAGVPVMMTPPSRIHQFIAWNFMRLLNRALDAHRPDLCAIHESGVRVPGVEDFQPEPDVVVVDRIAGEGHYWDRFYAVFEVLSPTNTPELVHAKRAVYERAETNLYVLLAAQDRMEVTIHAREHDWRAITVSGPDRIVALPAFDIACTLADIYAHTPVGRG